MSNSSNFTVRFYIRRDQTNKDGTSTIMVRVTVNGERAVFSSKLSVDPKLWDNEANRAMGTSRAVKELNRTLEDIRATIRQHYYELERYEALVTAEKVRNAFLGITVRTESILQLFKELLEEYKALEGISKSKATVQKYTRCYKRVEQFLKTKYKLSDMPLVEIDHKFIVNFECYLRTVSKCNENTSAKFLQTFKMVIIRARNNGYIKGDPFSNYKIRLKRVDRGYLTEEELERLRNTPITSKRVAQVRDVFLFCCYTGLAYIDLKLLREDNIRTSFDGKQWIMTHRHKTDTVVNVPILDIPMELLARYKGQCKNGYLLPILSNQKCNQYLKDVAKACNIDKNITFHMARHTFATTVTLSQGVPIESVSKMLGHTNIKTTQIYARITNQKISRDMEALAEKMRAKQSQSCNDSDREYDEF
ncbi:MAG: site-specific integrase [Prevotella sp.]|nr:site-specific integrase [Bacteroides sp.]MCM1367158.1 site-specific integrase [Prevotella sp.]MCM1436266.1 site-specific integrase [Prevotella sp.]